VAVLHSSSEKTKRSRVNSCTFQRVRVCALGI
jgi:hypothetical protein